MPTDELFILFVGCQLLALSGLVLHAWDRRAPYWSWHLAYTNLALIFAWAAWLAFIATAIR